MNLSINLNKEQLKAVRHKDGPMLILAGAGSGKTMVITHRIFHLIKKEDIPPNNILAVTFTNKSADEMKERIEKLLGKSGLNVWISTFHSLCAKILRKDINNLGYSNDFIIYDAGDHLSLVKSCASELNICDDLYTYLFIARKISNLKNNLITPDKFKEEAQDFNFLKKTAEVYSLYQKRLKENNALDFDDLIVKTIQLFEEHIDILQNYQKRFRYIMVDEYQDTNHAQYKLINLLTKAHCNLCVVGDDDQSIYQWRGANLDNIFNFEKDYPDTIVIKLEENYRSTQNILDAAGAVVSKNSKRKEKRLWTKREAGEKIVYARTLDEKHEVEFVYQTIEILRTQENHKYKDIAVFYRTNAQSRVIEDTFITKNIPHRIIGGLRFYERKEIKDILAYIRVLINLNDSMSLKRIINVPHRGIGNSTIEKIEQFEPSKEISLFERIRNIIKTDILSENIRRKLKMFTVMIEKLREGIETKTVSQIIRDVLGLTGYLEKLNEEKTTESEERAENVQELITAAEGFDVETETGEKVIHTFLDRIALISDADTMNDEAGAVTIMTLHTSKGLEFPSVFIVGMENNIFPHAKSMDDVSEMEEERRLCYVGMTRAKDRLFLSNAEKRHIYGMKQQNPPSMFLYDIPTDLLERRFSKGLRPMYTTLPSQYRRKGRLHYSHFMYGSSFYNRGSIKGGDKGESKFIRGGKVVHPQFGLGIIMAKDGKGDELKLTIDFKEVGKKKLVVKYVPLKVL
ncbi:MAG: UvrD-helicase domain-containing protein [Nitrospinae bacterium]|nr:UvrD-helicase domain-containing protein [Nitrospinota bacterium]